MLSLLYYIDDDHKSGNRFRNEKRLGLSNATGSRATLYWADLKRPKQPGIGMLDVGPDPEDRRFQIVKINEKGERFLGRMLSKMDALDD